MTQPGTEAEIGLTMSRVGCLDVLYDAFSGIQETSAMQHDFRLVGQDHRLEAQSAASTETRRILVQCISVHCNTCSFITLRRVPRRHPALLPDSMDMVGLPR